jgi:hypothetical protein
MPLIDRTLPFRDALPPRTDLTDRAEATPGCQQHGLQKFTLSDPLKGS